MLTLVFDFPTQSWSLYLGYWEILSNLSLMQAMRLAGLNVVEA